MSPENCDDIKILCKYERTPSFYNLKAAYSKLTPDYTISMETFEVDPQRLDPSSCPKHFPPLGSFIWVTDSIHDLKCPSEDAIDVCQVVQVRSILRELLHVVPFVLFTVLSIAFFIKRIRTGQFSMCNFTGTRKATGPKGFGLKNGESDTLISSSMSIEKNNYESIGEEDIAHSNHA